MLSQNAATVIKREKKAKPIHSRILGDRGQRIRQKSILLLVAKLQIEPR